MSCNEPQQEFRGVWIPPEIFNLLETGELSTTEILLLALVDSYVRCKGDGCWASNGRLGEQLGGLTKKHVSDLIAELIKKKWIVRHGWKKTSRGSSRILETAWSRISKHKGRGVSGKNRKGEGGYPEKTGGGYPGNSGPIKRLDEKSNSVEPLGANAPRSLRGGANGSLDFAGKLAREVHEGIKRKNKIMAKVNMAKWEEACRRIVRKVVDRDRVTKDAGEKYVRRLFLDHIEHLADKYQPKRYSLPEMANDLVRLEEARIRRQGDDAPSPAPKGEPTFCIYGNSRS